MRERFIRIVIILLIFLIQLLFLAMIIEENTSSFSFLALLIFITAVWLYTYWKLPLHQVEWKWDRSWNFLAIPASALITYYLNVEVGLGPVFSVGIVGFLGTFIHKIAPKSKHTIHMEAPIYCGTFIGMSTISVSEIYYIIILASVFSSILFICTQSLYVGVGGKLGTLAFVGVVLSIFVFKFIVG